jgi:hypothetical protein
MGRRDANTAWRMNWPVVAAFMKKVFLTERLLKEAFL